MPIHKGEYQNDVTYNYESVFYQGEPMFFQGITSLGNLPTTANWYKIYEYLEPKNLNWQEIQQVVRRGKPHVCSWELNYRPPHTDYTNIVWEVAAHDYDIDVNGILPHSMTLLTRDCLANIQFDNVEALYYAENGPNCGTYNFTLLASDVANGGGFTYQFTLANRRTCRRTHVPVARD